MGNLLSFFRGNNNNNNNSGAAAAPKQEEPKQQQQQKPTQEQKPKSDDKGKDESEEHEWGSAEADKLRQEADYHAKMRAQCFQESQEAYKNGDGKLAKEKSEEGKKHEKLMEEKSKEAAEYIFKEKNSKQDEFSIDLHGLRVNEAIEFLEQRVEKQKKSGLDHLIVIYGAGNHSEGGVRKIKPEVEKLLKSKGLKFETGKPNEGCCWVEMK